jgi:NAD(P)-dependent dehydrogenase (short-subunit alcohol dehydrogenase family)
MKFSFTEASRGIVFGAGRGVGYGIVKALLESTSVQVCAVYRSEKRAGELIELSKQSGDRLILKQLDSIDEESLKLLYEEFSEIDFIINSIGLLHDDKMQPERKIEDCNHETMIDSFKVNALITLSLAKTFKNSFRKKSATLFSTVSAKVGSIDDNSLGGWYSYRVSKAALNMLLKNIAIEFSRRACNTSVVAIHPGTTITELSKPFIQKTNYKLHSPEETGRNIIKVLDNTEVGEEAQFLSWDGSKIAW